jgi:hypothetical protein
VCGIPEQAAQYHMLGFYFWGIMCDPALGWLQAKEMFLFCSPYSSLKTPDGITEF